MLVLVKTIKNELIAIKPVKKDEHAVEKILKYMEPAERMGLFSLKFNKSVLVSIDWSGPLKFA